MAPPQRDLNTKHPLSLRKTPPVRQATGLFIAFAENVLLSWRTTARRDFQVQQNDILLECMRRDCGECKWPNELFQNMCVTPGSQPPRVLYGPVVPRQENPRVFRRDRESPGEIVLFIFGKRRVCVGCVRKKVPLKLPRFCTAVLPVVPKRIVRRDKTWFV